MVKEFLLVAINNNTYNLEESLLLELFLTTITEQITKKCFIGFSSTIKLMFYRAFSLVKFNDATTHSGIQVVILSVHRSMAVTEEFSPYTLGLGGQAKKNSGQVKYNSRVGSISISQQY